MLGAEMHSMCMCMCVVARAVRLIRQQVLKQTHPDAELHVFSTVYFHAFI